VQFQIHRVKFIIGTFEMIWVSFFNTSMYYEAGALLLFVIVSPTTLPHD